VVNRYKKTLLLLFLAALVSLVMITTDFGDKLTLSRIRKGAAALDEYTEDHYALAVSIFIVTYVAVNLWFPAAAALTLLAGFLFGTIPGTIYVDTAATIGAVLALALSRNIAGRWIQHRYARQLESFSQAMSRYGSEYLIGIRIVPVMPYFLVNALAGLTQVRLLTFAWTTALGSIPSILIFCYAGRRLLSINSVNQVLTTKVIIALVLLAGFVASVGIVRWAIERKKR
jgi:uncharacterized membrane protein YdjX (TVP38/TMEM64 family)